MTRRESSQGTVVRPPLQPQESQKRFEAIKTYQKVLDFFPEDVTYAAAALFRIGESHMQSGDMPKAMKDWLDLAADADYAKEPLGAAALNGLAENLIKQGKADEGIGRFAQVAVEFRKANPEAAREAIAKVVPHYVRNKPDALKLREFYVAVQTFQHGPHEPGADVATDEAYWANVRRQIGANDTFTDVQKGEREAFYRYWAGQLRTALRDDDDQQIAIAACLRAADGDAAAWAQRLDEQFASTRRRETTAGSPAGWACSRPTRRRPTNTIASSTSRR